MALKPEPAKTPPLTIFHAILGDEAAADHMFSVTGLNSMLVAEWREQVQRAAPSTLDRCKPADLILWKLREPIASEEADDKLAALAKDQNLSRAADKMVPSKKLSHYFPSTPTEDSIHVIVQLPSFPSVGEKHGRSEDDGDSEPAFKRKKRPSPPLAQIYGLTTRRNATVDALYQRLKKYRFVMVRGTPASGKSTLAQLLANYIHAKEPAVDPIMISTWANDGSDWQTRLTANYIDDGPNTIIIDEAQLTYWDNGFWNGFLKQITPEHPSRVILFVSYGSPTAARRLVFPCLRPVDHQDTIPPAGLFLPADEFSEMVKTVFPTGRFTTDFLDYVLGFTAGHTGAVADFLRIVMADDSYRQLKHEAGEYTLVIFQSQFPIAELWSRLDSSSIFRRGLPLLGELQEPPVARVFREVLRNNNVTKQMLDSKEDQDALDRCFKWGWLHATADQTQNLYIFTTPLHQWFVEYYLGTQISDPALITDQNLRTFAIEVMRRFSPRRLSSPRKIGASNLQRPPEAQFQDEFYRCCHEYSKGSLISFPEYGGASGRIDLYIPLKKWGVELLRDGDRLENHSSRFMGPGPYAKMQFEDYIILDFRTARPQKKHPEIANLYHVVFENDLKQIEIQDGLSLQTVAKFELLDYN